jgi:hypothetical protein
VGFFPISRLAGHIIKTEDDFRLAEALLPLGETRAVAPNTKSETRHSKQARNPKKQ